MTPEYLAGLFDGEGCITISLQRCSHGYKCFNVQPVVVIGMAHSALPIIMEINAQYGGTLRLHKRNPGCQDITYIKWTNKYDIATILTTLLPYLKLKREQAKLVLWWVNSVDKSDTGRYGMVEAKDIFIADLKAMKKNMLLSAESSINRIEDCFVRKNVVSISR
jgi:LAGLIDADG endonuclease